MLLKKPRAGDCAGLFHDLGKARIASEDDSCGSVTAEGQISQVQGGSAQYAQATDQENDALQRAQASFPPVFQSGCFDQGYAG